MKKTLLTIMGLSAVLLVCSTLLTDRSHARDRLLGLDDFGSTKTQRRAIVATSRKPLDPTVLNDSTGRWGKILPEMPEPTRKIRINMPGHLAEVFNDSNYVHWADAEKIGIKPLTDTRSYFRPGRDLVKVVSNADYYVDSLTHSEPYLVPEAAAVLHEIGRRFNDSLAARGGGAYRIRVTSLLRTPETVARLRHRNPNAVDSSTHTLGATFDITYSRFACHSARGPHRSAEDLKNLLGEVLLAMRDEGKVWVKFERKQPCYHVTARKPHAKK